MCFRYKLFNINNYLLSADEQKNEDNENSIDEDDDFVST